MHLLLVPLHNHFWVLKLRFFLYLNLYTYLTLFTITLLFFHHTIYYISHFFYFSFLTLSFLLKSVKISLYIHSKFNITCYYKKKKRTMHCSNYRKWPVLIQWKGLITLIDLLNLLLTVDAAALVHAPILKESPWICSVVLYA